MKEHVTVRVPASTSNLGPGFDCLGIALRLHNSVTLRAGRNSSRPSIVIKAAEQFFRATALDPFPFSCRIKSDIPIARGLGSSAAIRLGVLAGLNKLSGTPLNRNQLFAICAGLEGHPDNAAATTFGGFTVIRNLTVQRFNVSASLKFVILIPDFEIQTEKARQLLPPMIPRADAIMNTANVAMIVATFASGLYENLRCAFKDALHQPYRQQLIPFLNNVITAAETAGALGAFLSGSGSSICAVTLSDTQKIGQAMKRSSGLKRARVLVTTADNQGARVLNSPRANCR